MSHYNLPHNHGQNIERVLDSRRAGKEVYYSLSDTPQAKLLHRSIDALFECGLLWSPHSWESSEADSECPIYHPVQRNKKEKHRFRN